MLEAHSLLMPQETSWGVLLTVLPGSVGVRLDRILNVLVLLLLALAILRSDLFIAVRITCQ